MGTMFEIEAKKSLGQNFLKNTTIIEKIVDAGDIQKGDYILEIGPGTGAMTSIILEKVKAAGDGAKLIVIEKDRRAIPILEAKFKAEIESGTLEIIEGDFLELEIAEIFKKEAKSEKMAKNKATSKKTEGFSYKIIANIPYYITGAIIRKVLEDEIKPKKAIFLVQKEVAERITRKEESGSGKAGRAKSNILAESISAYGRAEYLFTVVRGNFVPAPRVDSAAICISDISNQSFIESGISEDMFFEVMKAGFAHKRKKLSGNLKEYLSKKGISAENTAKIINQIFGEATRTPENPDNTRAEEISTEKWFEITEMIAKNI